MERNLFFIIKIINMHSLWCSNPIPRDLCYRYTCTCGTEAALFKTAESWKRSRCPKLGGYLSKNFAVEWIYFVMWKKQEREQWIACFQFWKKKKKGKKITACIQTDRQTHTHTHKMISCACREHSWRAHKEILNTSVLWEEELKTGDKMKGRLTIYLFMNFVPSEYIACIQIQSIWIQSIKGFSLLDKMYKGAINVSPIYALGIVLFLITHFLKKL